MSQVSPLDGRMLNSALANNSAGVSESITRVITRYGSLSTSAGGTLASIVSWDASLYSDFSTFQPLYDEWRPIGAEIMFTCNQVFSVTSTARMVICVYDNDDAGTALNGQTNALDYHNKTIFNIIWANDSKPRLKAAALSTGDPSAGTQWITTGTTNPNKSFKLYASGLTVSTNYLDFIVRYVVQFRQPT